MSFNNIIQPPRVGPKITNSLGFIRRDLAVSYVDAVQVTELQGNCCCPVLKTYCLRLPCDLATPQCQCQTVPLIDTKTGEPFLIKKGTLLTNILIAKCDGVCVDPNMTLILGAMTGSPSTSDCNRWIAESNCVSGEFINCACFIQVDAAAKCRNVQMQACTTKCCGGNQGASVCAAEDTCPGDCGACGRCLNCCNGSSPVGSNDPCFPNPGPCPVLRYGSLEDTMISITVCTGALYQSDLTFTVQAWEFSGPTDCNDCTDCAGPNYTF